MRTSKNNSIFFLYATAYLYQSPMQPSVLTVLLLILKDFCVLCVCVLVCPSSTVKEHGAWRVVPHLQAKLSLGPGESFEGRLAEETKEHHEKLAAALVCPENRSSVFLQRSR